MDCDKREQERRNLGDRLVLTPEERYHKAKREGTIVNAVNGVDSEIHKDQLEILNSIDKYVTNGIYNDHLNHSYQVNNYVEKFRLNNLVTISMADITAIYPILKPNSYAKFIKELTMLPNLKKFHFNLNFEEGWDNINLKYLKGLQNLTHLRFPNILINDNDLKNISSLNQLNHLSIFLDLFSEEGIGYLKKLSNLKTLRLNFTSRSFPNALTHSSGVQALNDKLQKILPEVKLNLQKNYNDWH